MKIGVISDTHIPVQAKSLPAIISKKFNAVDFILHAGDLINMDTFNKLNDIAQTKCIDQSRALRLLFLRQSGDRWG